MLGEPASLMVLDQQLAVVQRFLCGAVPIVSTRLPLSCPAGMAEMNMPSRALCQSKSATSCTR